MKLYGALASLYVARVVLAAKAKGVDLVPEMPPGGMKSPEHLAMNPLGKIPALDDGGKCVVESEVIVEYLDETLPGRKLLPGDAYARSQARVLSRMLDLYLNTQTGPFFRNMNPATRNQAEVDAAKEAFRKGLGALEHFMSADGPYATGKDITVADCAMFPAFLMYDFILPAFGFASSTEGFPKLTAWKARMEADAIGAPFAKAYREAFQAFVSARR
jgi:glutathione S-transferase